MIYIFWYIFYIFDIKAYINLNNNDDLRLQIVLSDRSRKSQFPSTQVIGSVAGWYPSSQKMVKRWGDALSGPGVALPLRKTGGSPHLFCSRGQD